jgi:glucose/arabinose dehydrogenase
MFVRLFNASIQIVMCCVVVLLGVVSCNIANAQTNLQLERISNGFSRPVFATEAPGEPGRLYVIEQHTGRVRILNTNTGAIAGTPFLTVTGISTGNEQGLLGLAFHPSYETNGYFFVHYTASNRATRIRRYTAINGVVDTSSVVDVISASQPQSNHNGGWIGFGPDGFLYIALGDGGASNDIGSGHTSGIGNSRDITNNLLGKILRLDIDGDDFPTDSERNYGIPTSNPFVGVTGDDEIFSFALRNPYRCSFDSATGDLYIADVGQNAREEINVVPAGGNGGEDFGWRLREGTIATPSGGVGGTKPVGAIDPVHEYTHGGGLNQGRSVTGGYVYRGDIDALVGQYFFADFVSNRIWSFAWDSSQTPDQFNGTNLNSFFEWTNQLTTDVGTVNAISSFAENSAGELFVIGLDGEIFRITGATVAASTTGDYLRDGEVNLTDVDLLWKNIGSDSTGANATFDLDQNGSVDFPDLAQLLAQFVQTSDGSIGTLPGDLNLDGRVDVLADAFALVANLGQTVDSYADGDINGDRIVNVLGDAFILVANLGQSL